MGRTDSEWDSRTGLSSRHRARCLWLSDPRPMSLRTFHRRRPIAWMALFAILLVALAPTVSQVAASLRHGGEQGHAHAEAMQADAHAGHGSHAQEMHEAPPED